jgi:signal transduction histidine kinase
MFAIVRLNQHNYFQASIDIFYVFVEILSYYILYKKPQYYNIVSRFVFAMSVAIAIFVLITTHQSPMRFLWLSIVVYMLFYVFEKKEGLFWTFFIVTVLFGIMLYDKDILAIRWIDFVILITNIIVVSTIAIWYDSIEKESTQRFIDAKNMLTKEVEIKTAQLQAKTKELEELNNTLEDKIAQKIQENKKHEEILFKQAKFVQIGEMINMIAHQWRQPLNAISATNASLKLKLESTKDKDIDKEELLKKIDRMGRYIQDLSKTIDDFRITYSESIQMDRANLQEIIDNVIELFKSDLSYRNIQISRDFKCKLLLQIYRNELTQVLINIIKNSEEAFIHNNISNPKIDIQTTCDDEFVYISIKDNAGGIDESIIDKIFDPYFTTKENLNGTGLGLYMSKMIITDKLQGDIWVESNGEFTTFCIKLPK